MKKDRGKDIIFLLFVLAVLILSILYFSVPERILFIENQMEWWKEFWNILIK